MAAILGERDLRTERGAARVHAVDVGRGLLDARLRDSPPHYATPGAAGLDLRACLEAPLTLAPVQAAALCAAPAVTLAAEDHGDAHGDGSDARSRGVHQDGLTRFQQGVVEQTPQFFCG